MRFFPKVKGSSEQAVPLIVGKDTVYVHENIIEVQVADHMGQLRTEYEYDEKQYTISEYMEVLSKELAIPNPLESTSPRLTYEELQAQMLAQAEAIAALFELLQGGGV